MKKSAVLPRGVSVLEGRAYRDGTRGSVQFVRGVAGVGRGAEGLGSAGQAGAQDGAGP